MKKTNVMTTVKIAAIVIVLATISTAFINQPKDIDTLNDRIASQQYDHARLSFCFTNQVKPCDDAAIKNWNDQNPEEAFNLNAR